MKNNENLEKLKDLISKSPFGYVKTLKGKSNATLLAWINTQLPLLQDPKFSITTKCYWLLHDIHSFPLCPICREPITQNVMNINVGYANQTCGKKSCRYAKAEQQRQKTCLKRYGATHLMSTKAFKQKSKASLKEKYGVEFCSQSPDIQVKSKATRYQKNDGQYESPEALAKRKQTCLYRYGKESCSQVPEFKQKAKETSMQRYGVEHPSQSEHAKEAAKKTCLERYGVEHYAQTDECKEKAKATCLEKYGTENVWNSGAIGRKNADRTKLERYGDANFNNRAKARQTCMTKLAVDNAIKSPKVAAKARASLMKTFYSERLLKHPFVKPLFSADEYAARSNETLLKWKCLKCSAEFEATCNWNFRKDYASVKSVARCPVCFPLHVSTSAEEKELAAFIKSCYPGQVLENWRGLTEDGKSQAHSKEIDVYLPEPKLGFEYDGLYWHQADEFHGNRSLHKTQLAEKQGIMLVHIRSDQWLGNKEFWQTFCQTLLKDKTAAFKLLYNVNQPELLVDRGLFSKAFCLDGWTLKGEVAPKAEAVKWAEKTYTIETCGQLLLEQTA